MADEGLEKLKIWDRSMKLATAVIKEVLPALPAEEKWALAHQLRRSVQSVPANIAEGYGRYYYQESIRFCYIARGSLEEAFTNLTLAHELGYIQPDLYRLFNNEIRELRKMIAGYISFLKQSKRGESEPGSKIQIREGDLIYDTDLPAEDISYV